MHRRYDYKDRSVNIFDAKSDGDGNLTFTYAKPESTREDLHSYGESYSATSVYGVTSGYSAQYDGRGSLNDNGVRVVGINWDNVKSAGGQTYALKEELKSRGFRWNGEKWIKR